MSPSAPQAAEARAQPVDVLIEHAVVVTMNARREVLADGAVAIRGRRIAGVGPTRLLQERFLPREHLDASRMVVVPGLVNAHFHASTEPIARGVVPDDTPFEENVFSWLSPIAAALTEEDEHLSAQLGAVECLKSGTTCFLEAGTGWHVDAVVEALLEVGIRARVGRRTWDRPAQPAKFRQSTDQAIGNLQQVLSAHRCHDDGRVKGWVVLVGHTTCSDPLWRAARALADEWATGIAFHMSPAASDPEGFLAGTGMRPVQHLDTLGVLGPDAVLVHGVYLDDAEVAVLAERSCNVAHCPTSALKVAYGVTRVGKVPELEAAGVNLCIGTDGSNASNYADMYRAAYLVAGLFKDARGDPSLLPAERVLEMATLGGARALMAEEEIGSIEEGKRADLVLHDRDRPEWTPLHDVASQLVYSADGRSVHTVFVDGRKVVEGYRLATVDEDALYARAQAAAESLLGRLGLPGAAPWRARPGGPAPRRAPGGTFHSR